MWPFLKKKAREMYSSQQPKEDFIVDNSNEIEKSREKTNSHSHIDYERSLNEPEIESGVEKNVFINQGETKEVYDQGDMAYNTAVYKRNRKMYTTSSNNLSNNRKSLRTKFNCRRNLNIERKRSFKNEGPSPDHKGLSDNMKEILYKAIKIKLNHENCGLTLGSEGAYIKKAGASEEVLTEKFIRTFTTYYSRYKRRAMPEIELPVVKQPFFQHCLQMLRLDDYFIMYLGTVHETLKSARKAFRYSYVGETNILQLRLDNIEGLSVVIKEIQDVYQQVNKRIVSFINENGCTSIGDIPFSNKHPMFHLYNEGTNREDENPHKDYPDIGLSNNCHNDLSYAWIGHVPISDDGTWINLWLTSGYAKTVKIEFGSILFLRSDVVFGGCTPLLDDFDNKLYERLCIYLDSRDQVYVQGFTNVWLSDGKTPLSHACYKPIKTII